MSFRTDGKVWRSPVVIQGVDVGGIVGINFSVYIQINSVEVSSSPTHTGDVRWHGTSVDIGGINGLSVFTPDIVSSVTAVQTGIVICPAIRGVPASAGGVQHYTIGGTRTVDIRKIKISLTEEIIVGTIEIVEGIKVKTIYLLVSRQGRIRNQARAVLFVHRLRYVASKTRHISPDILWTCTYRTIICLMPHHQTGSYPSGTG